MTTKTRTPHNVMRAVLDDEQYKNFCAAWNSDARFLDEDMAECFEGAYNNVASSTIFNAFDWVDTVHGPDYWYDIHDRLVGLENDH